MLRLVAEGAGHAAAAAVQQGDVEVSGQGEGGGAFPGVAEGFFVAVDVEDDVDGGGAEVVRAEAAGGEFAVEEFVEGVDVCSECAGLGLKIAPEELGVFVAEGEDGAGFEAD